MKKKYIIFTLILIIACFVSTYIFNLPAQVAIFNLSTSGNLGSAIGGLTAPIIGIVSAIIMYVTLSNQIESINRVRVKDESEAVLNLLNELNSEYDKFYYRFDETNNLEKKEFALSGKMAMDKFVHHHIFGPFVKLKYEETYQSKSISILIHLFKMVDKTIDMYTMNPALKALYNDRLKSVFQNKFEFEIRQLLKKCSDINESGRLIDEMSEFYSVYNKKYGPGIMV